MPAKSVKQRRFMAMCEHGKGKNCPDMAKGQMRDFAATSERDLPMQAKGGYRSKAKGMGR